VPVKAPHYHLMGGWACHVGPATVHQGLLRLSQPQQELPHFAQPQRALSGRPRPRHEPPLGARPHITAPTRQAEEAR